MCPENSNKNEDLNPDMLSKEEIGQAFAAFKKKKNIPSTEDYDSLFKDSFYAELGAWLEKLDLNKLLAYADEEKRKKIRRQLFVDLMENVFEALAAEHSDPADAKIYFSKKETSSYPSGKRLTDISNMFARPAEQLTLLEKTLNDTIPDITEIILKKESGRPTDIHAMIQAGVSTATSATSAATKLTKDIAVVDEAGKQIAHQLQAFSGGAHIGMVVIGGISFLRIPFMYLHAYISGEKVPFTISNNARWALAAATLALGLVSLLVAGVALPILLTLSSIAVADSLFTLGSYIHSRMKLNAEIKKLDSAIQETTRKIMGYKDRAEILKDEIRHYVTENTKIDLNHLNGLRIELNTLKQKYYAGYEKLKHLHENKSAKDRLLKQQKDPVEVVTRTISVVAGAVGLVGAALLLTPLAPIGLGLMAAAAVIGLANIVGVKIYRKVQEKRAEKRLEQQKAAKQSDKLTRDHTIRLESTAKLMESFFRDDNFANPPPNIMGQMAARLKQIIQANNQRDMLNFFIIFAKKFKEKEVAPRHINEIFKILEPKLKEQAFKLFREALENKEQKISDRQRTLLCCKEMEGIFNAHSITKETLQKQSEPKNKP